MENSTSGPSFQRPRRRPRIALGGILHETNTFAPTATTMDHFRQRSLLRGDEFLQAIATGPGAPAGAFSAAERATLVPLLFASATPGGPVTDDTFASLTDDLLDRLRWQRRRWPGIDGIVLFLHGAMVTTTDPDPEASLLQHVRAEVGPNVPIVAVIDSHATVSASMMALTDAMVAYRAYPHTDTFARGQEAMRLCLSLIDEPRRLESAWRKLPLMMPLLAQATAAESPFAPVVDLANIWRQSPGITSISLVPGFPYADVPTVGASVLVYGEHQARVTQAADNLATCWWNQRANFNLRGRPLSDLPTVPTPRPTVLADIADNPGAGGAGDATHLLRHLLSGPYQDVALASIHDPGAVAACYAAGIGSSITLAVGGRTHPGSGSPVSLEWTVTHLGDGVFINEGDMSPGARGAMGRTATVVHDSVSVILTEHRVQALDPGVFRACGVDPERCQWLAVKSTVHYRAGFRSLADRMVDVECTGLSPSTLDSLEYSRVMRPMVPLDELTGPYPPGWMEMCS